MGERRARPSRAPVCGHDRHTQSLRMSDWLRAVRDVRPTRLAGWAAARARGSTGAHPTLTPQRRDRRLEAARVAAVGAAMIPARLLLDSRVVDVPMAYNPTFVMLSSLKPLFFNSLKNELPFSDNAGA